MPVSLDHLIVYAPDREETARFYAEVLEFGREGERGPFEVLRVNDDLVLQIMEYEADLPQHYAFSMSRRAFDVVRENLTRFRLPFGDSFHAVGNMKGPGREAGARGDADTLYFNDPAGHLVEIRTYDPA